ncbi:hypothetical protein [Cyclobacterium qasimii]|uniref:Uncharacterized protein n=2 Tax=Cyclobacterium qasimii TaxID=1350429 RepID=S7WR07_9BACT|nr:hypothetical protein [Cyclobacterium qasimii]EPR69159.1 hypothetical protein ADICYQ_1807 [Cyclobacterium qasimii M12-11B]
MKSKTNKDLIADAEYGLDSRYNSKKERDSEAASLMEARLIRMKNLSKEHIIRAKLMQLKLKMKAYIEQPIYDDQNHFAQDINITPIRLSQVINNHRDPKDEFIMKLMIHSEKVYENICEFQKEIWYQVYFHEKLCDTMSSQEEWRTKLEKDVKLSEAID